MPAPKRPETHPSYFFSRCLFKRRLFFTFQTWAVLETSGRVELRGNWRFFLRAHSIYFYADGIFYHSTERRTENKRKKGAKKNKKYFSLVKGFRLKTYFSGFFFALQATICWSVTSVSSRFSSKLKHSCCRMIFKKKASETRILHQKGTVFSFRPPFSGYRTASMAAFLDQPGVRYMGSNPHLNTCTPGQSAAATGLIKWIKLSQAELNMFSPLVEAKAPHPACAWF